MQHFPQSLSTEVKNKDLNEGDTQRIQQTTAQIQTILQNMGSRQRGPFIEQSR